jgi:hypothetical protein
MSADGGHLPGIVSVSSFMERVIPVVDETIAALARTKFIEDPIAGIKYSRATSIISSAYKRHGRILETAIRESLRDSNRHRVWQEQNFRISSAADALVASMIGKANEGLGPTDVQPARGKLDPVTIGDPTAR